MKKFLFALVVLFFLAPLASSTADAQVVVRVGPGYHHRRYYHHRYYHHPYHRGYYHRY